MSTRVVIDKPVLSHYLGWDGPMGSDMRRRKRTLEFRARQSVGVKTGKLRADIKSKERVVVDGIQFEVGNWGVRYARAHHEGAKPHKIVPRGPGYPLRFQVAGKTVYAMSVNHPGNRPNPYLARWLREAVR